VKQRPRSTRIARIARFAVLSAGGMAVAACASLLGIDDRGLIGESGDAAGGDGALAEGSTGANDGPTTDASVDSPVNDLDATSACDPGLCGAIQGSCGAGGVCTIACTSASCPMGKIVQCPPGHDCRIECASGACDKVRCTGGRSCTIDCSANMSCHNGVACQAQDRCELICTGATDSCGGGGGSLPVECEAGVCLINCGGPASCAGGVAVSATSYCGIDCTGVTSCAAMSKPLSCGQSPDASIFCGPAMNTCQKAKPSCFGAYCEIDCLNTMSCLQNYCCEAGTCVVDAAARMNVCP
jgi:hypothetical protein